MDDPAVRDMQSPRPNAIQRTLEQPALNLGGFLLLACVIAVFRGGVLIALLVESMETAGAEEWTGIRIDDENERMLRDFGLLPPGPVDLSPIRIEYGGAPVPVVLGVGTERRIAFGQPFRFGLEPAVSGYFNLEIYDRYLLIRAIRPVSTRARVQVAGQIIPLDLQAVAGAGPAGPLEIVLSGPDTGQPDSGNPVLPPDLLTLPAPAPGYIDLVRYAAQRLYAPRRLQASRPGVRVVPVSRDPVRLIRGVRVDAAPIAGWEAGGLVVTAVRIENPGPFPVRLDPRQVVGQWRAAAFQHRMLHPGEATALYLVSAVPFEAALGIHRDVAALPDVSGSSSGARE